MHVTNLRLMCQSRKENCCQVSKFRLQASAASSSRLEEEEEEEDKKFF
jgi:hypothetical protein